MVLTGRAIKFAEGFEKLDEKIFAEDPDATLDEILEEDDQVTLYMITMMFHRSPRFRKFMEIALTEYAKDQIKEVI